MKDIDSRDKLISALEEYLSNLSPERYKKLEEEIRHDEKIDHAKFIALYVKRMQVYELSDAELYWLTAAASRISNRVGKPEKYFEDGEIKNYKYYVPEDEKKVERPIVFKDAVMLAENQYMFPCSIREIKKLKEANILQIVPELQRNSTKNKYNELKTKVNRQNAQQIADLIDNGGFYYNSIRFNLMDDGESDNPVYDADRHTLTVYDGTIIVPDGNHRTIGCELASKHLDDKFCVLFTFLSAQDTKRLLNQEWTTVPIPKKHKDSMKQTNPNEIVDGIIRSADADPIYAKEIVRDGIETRYGHGFILYSDLADAINMYYDVDHLEPKAKRDELRDWLINFMNFLTELLLDDFKNYKKVRKEKWSVNPTAWYIFIMISEIVRDNRLEWRDEVRQIISGYDFSDQNIRQLFVSHNKRNIYAFCKEERARICSMIGRNNNS